MLLNVYEYIIVFLSFFFAFLALFLMIFNGVNRCLQNKSRVHVWLKDMATLRMEGVLIGFDEYMNLVLDNAEEIDLKKGTRRDLGRTLLKGDTITLVTAAPVE